MEKLQLLKPKDAATLLAISDRKLWELTNCNEIPHVRMGRSLRYDQSDLRAWYEKKKQGGD